MKVTEWETLYHEDHGATLKHKCGKRIVTLSLLSFSLIFLFGPFSFFMASFFRPESHPDLWWNHSLHHAFLTWDNALIMMIITLLFFSQLNNYNSILRTKYDSIWMPPAVYRDMQWIKSDMYERIMNGGFPTNTMSTTWSCKQYDNDEACHNNRTVESCMAIYLGMAMEMPW